MRKRVVEIRRFMATDAAGRRVTVVVTADELHVQTLAGPGTWERGLQTYRLSDGQPVNVDSDGTLRLARDGSVLRPA